MLNPPPPFPLAERGGGGRAHYVMVDIQFSLIKKMKVGRPEHSLTPSHFCLTPHSHPSQSGRRMCVTP